METKKECGSCTLCCKILGVIELDKPINKWCEHCIKSVGCSIYDERPNSCKDFECGWLLSNAPLEWRPDKSHMIITGESDKLNATIIHQDPAYPISKYGQEILDFFAKMNKTVVLVTGNKREILSSSSAVIERINEILNQNGS